MSHELKLRHVLILPIALSLIGCASTLATESTPPPEKTKVVDKEVCRAWKEVTYRNNFNGVQEAGEDTIATSTQAFLLNESRDVYCPNTSTKK